MRRFARYVAPAMIVTVLVSILAATTQADATRLRALVVDETKSFASTMRVAALVGALRALGTLDVAVRLVDVESSYADPLEGEVPDGGGYDLILIVPRGLDRGDVDAVWVLSKAFALMDETTREIVRSACLAVDSVYAGRASAVDVQQDLFPALLWARYTKGGWTR